MGDCWDGPSDMQSTIAAFDATRRGAVRKAIRDRLEGDVEMGCKTKHLFRRARGFRKDADGSASIEFVLWMPVFMFILKATPVDVLFFDDLLYPTRFFVVNTNQRERLVGKFFDELF